jgi:hypothetical protein
MEHIPLAYITELLYPPMTLAVQSLKELYLRISGSYDFTQFKILPEGRGAQLQSEQRKALSILPDKLSYKNEPTEQTVEAFATEVGSIVRQVRELLRIPVFVSQVVVIRLLSPVHGGENGSQYIGRRLLGFRSEQLAPFGRPASGIGVRLVFPATRERLSEFQVRVEPYFQDMKMLFLENTARFFQPPQSPERVEENLRAAYDFLRIETTEFLEGLRREKGS